MTRECLRYAPMIGARPGELPEQEARALSSHLEACPSCRALATHATLTDGLLAEALLARANSRDFAPFVDQVMARVVGQATRRLTLPERLRRHWLALAVAAGLVLLAVGSAFMYVRKPVEERERVAAISMELEGGSIVLQTSDGPVVLLEPEDGTGS
jgi:anti-sigma factor RsiW